ncbi:hypothetical protein M2322_004739 [Rhodoblastus acidophilus]|uniref:DUF6338 family protein n=1 Tax=Rhodoblastus acidophilus TaxID=1074 RepID=UPI0022255D1E|nr:DUF6338 family protein [Rhodoblastus acidophilus]MCW2319170.1 hypothetical protein [Rhodoblastus acidophilus]
MPSITSFDSVYLLIAFFVPGFIVSWMRSQFLTGNEKAGSEQFIRYLTYSALNYALWSWLIFALPEISSVIWVKTSVWFVIVFVSPAVLGALLGLAAQRGWTARILVYEL